MITKTFMAPEELLDSIDPQFVEGPNNTTETMYTKENVIKLARAYGKEFARQVLCEADGGLEQSGKGYIPQAKFHEVLNFIKEQ